MTSADEYFPQGMSASTAVKLENMSTNELRRVATLAGVFGIPTKLRTTTVSKEDIALKLFMEHVDLNKPLQMESLAKACLQAAEVFLKTIRPEVEKTNYHHVIAAINDDKKINAIKELRALHGFGLKEAKDIIDSIWQHKGTSNLIDHLTRAVEHQKLPF